MRIPSAVDGDAEGVNVKLKEGQEGLDGAQAGHRLRRPRRLILVEWVDKRIFPNPSPEAEARLERIDSDSTR